MENRHLSEEQKRTIEESVRNILAALGDDPEREGLVDTPERVARMYDEVFEGMRYTNEEIARELGIGVKGVEYHITKALKKLRIDLKDFYPLLDVLL